MKTRSITKRVLGIVLAAQVACAVILSLSALIHERTTRLHAFDETIRGRSDSLLGAIQDAEDPSDSVDIDPAELKLPATDYYAVYSDETSLAGSSQAAPPGLIAKQTDGFHTLLGKGQRFRVYQRTAMRIIDRAENGGVGLRRPVTIVYASPETHIQHEIYEAAYYYILVILLVVAGTGVSVLLLIRKALRPLDHFAQVAGQLSAPLLTFEAPADVLAVSELRPLAAVLERVVAGLREAFEKEKRFVGDAAHELKTTVTVARSTVQVLMLKPRSVEEHSSGLGRVLEDIARVESLVAQMLSSAGSDRMERDAPNIDFSIAVSATVRNMQSLAEANGVAFTLQNCDHAYVKLRSERAMALISNLLLNAVQHSAPGMTVRITLRRTAIGHVVFEVIDTGRGIGAEALPHVFERFYREDQSRSRFTGGAGLGLVICKSVVEAAGGRVEIKSQPQKGTTVTVTFSEA